MDAFDHSQAVPSASILRHQSSLEGIMDFSREPPLASELRAQAKRKFYLIVEHFEEFHKSDGQPYNQPQLIRYTYEYARSEESQDNFLRAFFQALALSMDGGEDLNFDDLSSPFIGFAEHLFNNFFLPLRASGTKTPQPTPAYHSAIMAAQGGVPPGLVGTPDRLSSLRGDCLVRDRHRCVISRMFDLKEVKIRLKENHNVAHDDDGNALVTSTDSFAWLEVAHIIPHALMKVEKACKVDDTKAATLAILNMFDCGVVHLIKGPNIDRPSNAISLTLHLHRVFGEFDLFFEPILDQPHTYRIQSFLEKGFLGEATLPITRTLYLSENRTIDPPSPRLLALHSAIAHILHLSGAGEYIGQLLRDMDDMDGVSIREDGSTELGQFVRLRLGRSGHSVRT
ncbi:hypothetical protein PT974_01418 [Cladobotryum mycophilum]|uniref:HNH nuclease domain-containing protein n=1 Tax=Cladobotryum mycophilum TaxID=491253 RepID=A0ABR0T520_9HYPO